MKSQRTTTPEHANAIVVVLLSGVAANPLCESVCEFLSKKQSVFLNKSSSLSEGVIPF